MRKHEINKRKNKKHKMATQFLWGRVLQWANNKKISVEDLEIELAQIF